MPRSITRTVRLKVRPESYGWLRPAATEVDQVYHYCNQVAADTARRTDKLGKWLSGFDLCALTAGSTEYFEHIGADTIQRVWTEYAAKRAAAVPRGTPRDHAAAAGPEVVPQVRTCSL